MFLSYLKVENFKGMGNKNNEMRFAIPDMKTPGSGLNIFIGENNSGKTTIFEAIEFLRNGVKNKGAGYKNKRIEDAEDMFVEVEFSGAIGDEIESICSSSKKKSLKDQVYERDDQEFLKVKRCGAEEKILLLFNAESGEFKNVSGIDAPIKQLYENYFIWADTDPSDEAKFGATTLCGMLIKEIANSCETTAGYNHFLKGFHDFFNKSDSDLRLRLADIETKLTDVFSSQFGEAKLSFRFDELTLDNFFKNSTIEVDDGIKIPMHQEGQGMQRSIALALLQVYADIVAQGDISKSSKSIFLFIDEPELSLHPIGQYTLLDSLLTLSATRQVFITCHSPFFLQDLRVKNSKIFFFEKVDDFNQISTIEELNLFPWSPSWGEIVYKAYKLPTREFHNELFGFLEDNLSEGKIGGGYNKSGSVLA